MYAVKAQQVKGTCEDGEEKDMKVVTQPTCRVGSEGQVLRYVVAAEGATDLVVGEGAPEGLAVRIVETRQVSGGIEADVEIEVRDATPY